LGILPPAQTLNQPTFTEFFQNLPDHVNADAGTFFLNIGDSKQPKSFFY
jgi:hypothetical protein